MVLRAGNVEAALHDIGRQQNVRLTFDEAHHSIVDLVGRQPAMETYDAKVGAVACTRASIGSRSWIRGQIRKLWPWRLCSRSKAAAIAASDSGANLGDDRQPMNRRRCNHAEVPEARKTRRQRARYRRGAHPKGMNALRKPESFAFSAAQSAAPRR